MLPNEVPAGCGMDQGGGAASGPPPMGGLGLSQRQVFQAGWVLEKIISCGFTNVFLQFSILCDFMNFFTHASPPARRPENLKKSRPKNSWNEMNQFHGISLDNFSLFSESKILILMENIL